MFIYSIAQQKWLGLLRAELAVQDMNNNKNNVKTALKM